MVFSKRKAPFLFFRTFTTQTTKPHIMKEDTYRKTLNESLGLFGWIWREMITPPAKKLIGWFFLGSCLSIGVGLLGPLVFAHMFDMITNDTFSLAHILVVIIGTLVGIAFLETFFDWIRRVAREYIFGHTMQSVSDYITKKQFEKSLGQLERERSYLDKANLEKGQNAIFMIQGIVLFEFTGALVTLVISVAALLFLNVVSGLFVFMMLALQVFIMIRMNKKVVTDGKVIDNRFRSMNRYRIDRWDKASRVAYSNTASYEMSRLNTFFRRFILRDRKLYLWFIHNIAWRDFLIRLTEIGIVAYGIYLFKGDMITLGMLYPLFAWTKNAVNNIWRIGEIERQIQRNLPSLRSLKLAMDLKPDVQEAQESVVFPGQNTITFKNVGYSYKPSLLRKDDEKDEEDSDQEERKPVLQNVSFTIPTGAKAALVGPSGSGKTTLGKLLMRFDDPDSGSVKIGGVDIRDIKLNHEDSLRERVGCIPQRPQIFDGTIGANIAYGTNISRDQMPEIMQAACLDEDERFEHGTETKVGRDGIELSGGQQQRLSIASALARKPDVMIIDEATSSLDSETEKGVQKGIETILESGITSLIIAHRLSTLRNCDMFIVMRPLHECEAGESQIEYIGSSFEDTVKNSPTFRTFAQSQGLTELSNIA